MASRITNKINRQALQTICKSLYSGSTESSVCPRSSSNDASAAATITSNSTINNNSSNNINVSTSSITGSAPHPTPVSNTSATTPSVQSCQLHSQNQLPNTQITNGTDEFFTQNLSAQDTPQTISTTIGSFQLPSSSRAYQVCPTRPKTAPENFQQVRNQFNSTSYNKAVPVNKPVVTDHLQPGRQPQYYVAEMENNTPKASADALKEAVAQVSIHKEMNEPSASETKGGYRKIEESMTYRNLTQPFKFSRLASPFPEPVKEMASRKVSDQEKAAQMFAESRNNALAQAHFEQRKKQLRLKPQVPLQPNLVRHYSSDGTAGQPQGVVMPDPKKCKKPVKSKCPKIKVDKPCPPANLTTSCKDNRYVYKKCTKKEAPYPSYSESCHEERPFVCRTCPWMDDVHPAFKPKKKNYHTDSRAMSLTSVLPTSLEVDSSGTSHDMNDVNSISDAGNGSKIAMELKKRKKGKNSDCEERAELKKIPCAWVELEKEEDLKRSRMRPKKIPKKTPKKAKEEGVPQESIEVMDPPAKKSLHISEIAQQMRDMTIDVAKKKKVLTQETPCTRKKMYKCPPNSNFNIPLDKKKRRSPIIQPPISPSIPEKKAAAAASNVSSPLYIYDGETSADTRSFQIPEDVAVPAVGQSIDDWLAGLHPNKAETHSNVVTITSGGPCPKFPFKPMRFNLVIHRKPKLHSGKCPKLPKKPLVRDCPPRNLKDCLAELFDDALVLKKKSNDSKKCPKVPLKPMTEPDPAPDDPCNRKRKPESEICPGDLLTRRRKDKPFKRTMNTDEDFEQAVAMLDAIQRTRSAPSVFNSYIK